MWWNAGDHECDDIVIEVHETKWGQKNTEVCMQQQKMILWLLQQNVCAFCLQKEGSADLQYRCMIGRL